MLAEAGASYADLRRIGVAAGPGSFTGIRVGVAAARGLALALDIPAVGIDTLEALAAPHLAGERPVLCVLDARRGELYAELFHSSGIGFAGPAAIAPGALADFIAPIGEEGLDLVGTGAGIAAGALGDRAGDILSEANAIDIEVLARLAALQEPDGAPVPLYLRGADAKPATAARSLFATAESIL